MLTGKHKNVGWKRRHLASIEWEIIALATRWILYDIQFLLTGL